MNPDLAAALEALSAAHGESELIRAMARVRRMAKAARIKGDQGIGRLSAAVMAAIEIRDKLKADGVTGAELDAGLEGVLRDMWPKGREWKYLCQQCGDLGLEMHACPGDATCGRPREHLPHDYGTPCWCEKGKRFREKPKPEPSEFTEAGKTPKRQSFSKFGR